MPFSDCSGKSDNKTLFIDASNGCIKVTNNNNLIPENIDRIVTNFTSHTEEAHFSHLASYEEIESNDYNLSVSTYVEARDTREKIDIGRAGQRCSYRENLGNCK